MNMLVRGCPKVVVNKWIVLCPTFNSISHELISDIVAMNMLVRGCPKVVVNKWIVLCPTFNSISHEQLKTKNNKTTCCISCAAVLV